MARDSPKATQDYLRLLENPYASLQIGEDLGEDFARGARPSDCLTAARPQLVRAPTQVDLLAAQRLQSDAVADTRHGNPYAALASIDDEEVSVVSVPGSGQDLGQISQAEFEAGCRRIFGQYIPRLERRRLRPEHRDFITRNRTKTAKSRFRLLEALHRYDLSDLPAMQPQFNRENDRLTAKKLIEIERSIGKDE